MRDIKDIDFEYMLDYFEEIDEMSGSPLSGDAYDALERLSYQERTISDVEILVENLEQIKQKYEDVFEWIEEFDEDLLEEIFEDMKGLLA